MNFQLVKSTCPFCPKAFKASGWLSKHLEREYSGRRLLVPSGSKRKFDETRDLKDNLACDPDTNSFITVDVDANCSDFMMELAAIRSAFPNIDLALPENTVTNHHLEHREFMPYMSSPETPLDANSDGMSSLNLMEAFPSDRKAGHVVVNTPFDYARNPKYNFFRPFAHVLDYKLARFFHAAHVPKARIDKFFNAGFVETGTARGKRKTRQAQSLMGAFSFRSSYTLYKKLNEMLTSPSWGNGYVDFRLAKDTEFWYRNVLDCIHYLVRQKCYEKDIVWSPVWDFDVHGDRVYTEMNTGTWWWDTQVFH